MTAGVPNFVGERLKEAREARGLTGAALAELVGVARASISLYELGRASPQLETMVKLSTVLNCPPPFFLRPPSPSISDNLFYRSMSGATKVDRLKARRRYAWLKEITSYLRGFVRFPRVNIPSIPIPDTLSDIDADVIESAATQTRREWGLGNGPISDVTLLLENNGAIVSKVSLGTMQMDGFSGWCPNTNTPYIVLGADKGSAVRSRFDIAHELGHIVLHRALPSQHVNSPISNSLLERQAYQFAGAFLLPAESFSDDIYTITLDSLKALKSKWLVSIGAMLVRAERLNLIAEQPTRRMWANYNRRGWKRKEPLDDELQPEYPRLLRRAFELIVTKKVHTLGQIASDLALSRSDIRELSCIHEDLLGSGESSDSLEMRDGASKDLSITQPYVLKRGLPANLN